ncbi:cytochrome c3 family protein [bacterium]|nr:cytochrome c3 family protein [bacterium]
MGNKPVMELAMLAWLKKRWKVSCLVLLLVFGGCSWAMLEYTHYPGFCKTCHVMDPYYDAWASSSHNMVGCVDCHYEPGLRHEFEGKLDAINQVVAYWTGRYDTKFYAEIGDASCMRSGCHDSRLIEGPIEYKRGINFDHAGHYGHEMRGIRLRCTSCHSQIVQGNHMAVTDFTCFLCHFKGKLNETDPQPQEFCLSCHNYPNYYVGVMDINYDHTEYVENGISCQYCHIDVVEGQGEVEDRACLQCHSDPAQLEKVTDVIAVHQNHVTDHKVECFNCHAEIKHHVPETVGPPEVGCATCHTDTHLGPRELYSGTGGRGVADMPSTMFKVQVDCVGCHHYEHSYGDETIMKGWTRRPGPDACAECHPEWGREVYANWTSSIDAQLAETEIALNQAERAAETLKRQGMWDEARQQLLDDARHNYVLVRYGRGVHNITYSLALLEKAREDAKQAVSSPTAAE